jgi:hypothetical protein
MAYDRYDTRDERSRWRNESSEDRWDRNSERDQGRGGSDDRGFFERAGDEIASWFGDDEAERRRHQDQMRDNPSRGRGFREQGGGWRSQREDSGWGSPDRDSGSASRDRNSSWSSQDRGADQSRASSPGRGSDRWSGSGDDRSFRSRDWERGSGRGFSASTKDYNPDWQREFGSREREGGYGGHDRGSNQERSSGRGGDYRPLTGDYGRGGREAGRGQRGFGDWSRDDDGQSEWGRDPYRSTSRAGTSDWTDRSRHEDPHYDSWRQRHLNDLDRDYDDYRRENQSRFEDDFAGWREKRQQKRGLLMQIREHMEVVGDDEKHVGTVDKVVADRIILAKSDPESGGVHHSLSCSDIGRVEGDRVYLDCSADKARERWRDESRGRALFERDDQGEMGPRSLDHSFSGTYR